MRALLLLALSAAPFVFTPTAFAEELRVNTVAAADISAAFRPAAETSRKKLDYTFLDDMLDVSVVSLGPSDRRRKSRPPVMTGSKIVTGHISAYRLEGNRITYHFLNESYLEDLILYRQELEQLGGNIGLTNLSKKEQLAYWFNLHNVAMIEQVLKDYYTKYPSRIKIGEVPLDDAKILNVKNIPLSLRDIREKIVFPNWKNPDVIYGFYRGDIGSPAIQTFAYSGENVDTLLKLQGYEFVNALRGFNLSEKARRVSKLYHEARQFYFQDWENDIEAHLLKYARDDVAEEVRTQKPVIVDEYDDFIGDLVGGQRPRAGLFRLKTAAGFPLDSQIPFEAQRLISENKIKYDTLKAKGLIQRGTVIIEDIETRDPDAPDP